MGFAPFAEVEGDGMKVLEQITLTLTQAHAASRKPKPKP